jgi:selenocysteine lyase/cysteine desulfurase
MFDVETIRGLFPITQQTFTILGKNKPVPVIYMDHGASTHPPQPVLDTYTNFLQHSYSNVHRGKHFLSQIATDYFEHVSSDILAFIGADAPIGSIILTNNTTSALDIAAHVMASVDGVTLVTLMEHHSNDLPHRRRGEVVHVNLLADGTLDYADLEKKLQTHKVKLVATTGASNVTGYMPDIERIAKLAHKHGAKILVDAAQLLAHKKIDVKPDNDPAHIDFLAGAGHKAYAPFGSAFLYAPEDLLNEAPPYIPGGGTVVFVTDDDAYYSKSPDRHQGGTPNIPGAIAFSAALKFLQSVGMDNVREHERQLTEYALSEMTHIDGIHVLGNPDPSQRLGVVSFIVDGLPHDKVSAILNSEAAIATRNGCFCAHPYIARLMGVDSDELVARIRTGEAIEPPGAVRATFGIYNTEQEVEELIRMVKVIRDRSWIGDYETDFVPYTISMA